MSGGAVAASGGGSPGEGVWAGFTFSPAPLIFNGQQVAAPDLQFSDPVAVSTVDQGSQAYSFTNSVIGQSFNFIGAANASVQDFNNPLFNEIYSSENQFGTSLSQSINTEANALATAAKNVGSGSGGGGIGGFLGKIFSLF
jgi:hypothetical protein